jgi:hypothetical protein
MLPVCGLEVFVILSRCPAWMQWTAGGVLILSLYGLAIGYGRRLTLGEDGASFGGLLGHSRIEWHQVRRVGIYQPGGGIGQTEYAYLSARDEPPAGKWEQNSSVIQIQNRPGLLETIERFRNSQMADQRQGRPVDEPAKT